MHRQRLMKMGMDDLLEFLQKTLESNFGYEVDLNYFHLNKNKTKNVLLVLLSITYGRSITLLKMPCAVLKSVSYNSINFMF